MGVQVLLRSPIWAPTNCVILVQQFLVKEISAGPLSEHRRPHKGKVATHTNTLQLMKFVGAAHAGIYDRTTRFATRVLIAGATRVLKRRR